MKNKTLFLVAALALTSLGCSSQNDRAYTIKGEVKGLPDGTMLQLLPVSHTANTPLDSALVSGGTFTFKGKADEPRAVYLLVKGGYDRRPLMLVNGEAATLTGTVTATPTGNGTMYDIEKLTVAGSPLTARYDSLLQVRDRMDEAYAAYSKQHQTISKELGEARQAKDKARIDSLTKTDAYKAMAEGEKNFFSLVEKNYHQVIQDNKNSFWGPLMMISLTSYLSEENKPWYDELSPEAKNSYYGRMVKEEVAPEGLVGKTVPPFTLKDSKGQQRSLQELLQGKKYVLIDFWASWCNPCRKEIPNIKKQYDKYAAKGFEVVSISIDKKRGDWEKALAEEKLPWPNFFDEGNVSEKYKVRFVPTLYLIDATGKVVAENPRGQSLADKLAELFK